MSRRTAESNKAILAAWNKEQELVQEGKGTREWTPQQQQDILEKGKAYDDNGKAFEGQHMKSAEKYPEYQGDPGNIQFLTRAEHLEAHDGNWQNPTNWYFDPVTKQKYDFGDGPFIPCEIIPLSEPIMAIQVKQVQETIVAQKLETTEKRELPPEKISTKSTTAKVESKLSFGEQLKIGLKKFGKTVVEFPAKHPTAMKVIKGIGIAAATITAAAVAESSKNGSSGSGYGSSSNNDADYDYNNTPDEYDDYSDDASDSDNEYTPNDVPAGKQRYHYKDGSVKWVEKEPYHRGGNDAE